MKFRKKHRGESEVFTDSLNDILFILIMFFLIVATAANPNVVAVTNPRGTKDTKVKQDIMVSINRDQQFYIGTTQIPTADIDTAIVREITRFKAIKDTPTVIINADTSAYYGEVFRIMRLSKA